MRARLTLPLMLLALLSMTAAPAHAVDGASLKAAFVYNFGAFTTWPADAGGGNATLTLCVADDVDAGLAAALRTLTGKLVHERPLAVRMLALDGDPSGCAMLVLASDRASSQQLLHRARRSRGVLTVCDCPAAGDDGAMFHLALHGTRLRFEVDRAAAQAAGLTVSSRLLRLAAPTR